MDYETFLNRIIDEGIIAAKHDYECDDIRRKGAIAAFEACRQRNPNELLQLLTDSKIETVELYKKWNPRTDGAEEILNQHTEKSAFTAEVEWVCNVLSAGYLDQGYDIVPPTARGVIKAAQILGVQGA